jgi:hypothetical protein
LNVTYVHPDGRKWFGRIFGRLIVTAIVVPGDEAIVRRVRSVDGRAAAEKYEVLRRELTEAGFLECAPEPWPVPEPRAGAVIVARGAFGDAWIPEAFAAMRRRHGPSYTQRFVTVPLREVTACFYEIAGYATRDECAAFEDAFFFIDGFASRLRGPDAPERFVALSDVGLSEETWYAVKAIDQTGRALEDVEGALSELGCSLTELRDARQKI